MEAPLRQRDGRVPNALRVVADGIGHALFNFEIMEHSHPIIPTNRWLDDLEVFWGGYDANDNPTGSVKVNLTTDRTTRIDLSPLGSVYQLYTRATSSGEVQGTAPSCLSNNTQLVISSLTFQGDKRKDKAAPQLYIKDVNGDTGKHIMVN